MAKRILILCFKLAITAGAIVYLFVSEKLDLSQLVVEPGGWGWIAAAALGCFCLMLLSQIRYWILLKRGGVDVGVLTVIRIGFISWFFNATLLGGLGFLSGDAIKVGYLLRESSRRANILGATLIDRLFGLMGLITLAVFAVQVGWKETVQTAELRGLASAIYAAFAATGLAVLVSVISLAKGRGAGLVGWIVFGGVAAWVLWRIYGTFPIPLLVTMIPLAVGMTAPAFLPGGALHDLILRRIWMGNRIMAFVSAILEYRRRGGTMLAAYVLSVAIHIAAIWILFLSAQGISLPVEPTLRQIWFAAPPVNALSALPLPAGGLGVGEAAFDTMMRFCAGPDGAPLVGGAALFLSFRILMTLTGLVGLPIFLASPRRHPVTNI